jgi:hypothetical protein
MAMTYRNVKSQINKLTETQLDQPFIIATPDGAFINVTEATFVEFEVLSGIPSEEGFYPKDQIIFEVDSDDWIKQHVAVWSYGDDVLFITIGRGTSPRRLY